MEMPSYLGCMDRLAYCALWRFGRSCPKMAWSRRIGHRYPAEEAHRDAVRVDRGRLRLAM